MVFRNIPVGRATLKWSKLAHSIKLDVEQHTTQTYFCPRTLSIKYIHWDCKTQVIPMKYHNMMHQYKLTHIIQTTEVLIEIPQVPSFWEHETVYPSVKLSMWGRLKYENKHPECRCWTQAFVPSVISNACWKNHQNPFLRFSVMLLTGTLPEIMDPESGP